MPNFQQVVVIPSCRMVRPNFYGPSKRGSEASLKSRGLAALERTREEVRLNLSQRRAHVRLCFWHLSTIPNDETNREPPLFRLQLNDFHRIQPNRILRCLIISPQALFEFTYIFFFQRETKRCA